MAEKRASEHELVSLGGGLGGACEDAVLGELFALAVDGHRQVRAELVDHAVDLVLLVEVAEHEVVVD